jgi:acetate kinase
MKPGNLRIMTVDGGSSSIKFALFGGGGSLHRILQGGIERIGLPDASFHVKSSNQADSGGAPKDFAMGWVSSESRSKKSKTPRMKA